MGSPFTVRRLFTRACGFGVLLLALGGDAGPALAQHVYGTVVGVVRDTSDAAVPGATVMLRNRDTNLVLTAVSNDTGSYTVTNVLPGPYDISVALPGATASAGRDAGS